MTFASKSRRWWLLAAVVAAVGFPSAGALAGGSPVGGTISAKGASVKLSSAACGHNVLLKSYTAVAQFQFWTQPERGAASLLVSNVWTGTGEKAVYVPCHGYVGGWIQAVGASGKFPAYVSSLDQFSGTNTGGTPVRQPATP